MPSCMSSTILHVCWLGRLSLRWRPAAKLLDPSGGTDFYGSRYGEPDVLLEDFVALIYPEIKIKNETQWWQNVYREGACNGGSKLTREELAAQCTDPASDPFEAKRQTSCATVIIDLTAFKKKDNGITCPAGTLLNSAKTGCEPAVGQSQLAEVQAKLQALNATACPVGQYRAAAGSVCESVVNTKSSAVKPQQGVALAFSVVAALGLWIGSV